jgi:8-oxo-dGTP diphosphatase
MTMDKKVEQVYGNKVRVRTCGICIRGESLLMVNHAGITPTDFWSPPGGGVEFGETIEKTLKKEFAEETGLDIIPGAFLFGCEFVQEPIHSIELFYTVTEAGGKLRTGFDPEIQIIKAVEYIPFKEIKLMDSSTYHGIFRSVDSIGDLLRLKGFYRI